MRTRIATLPVLHTHLIKGYSPGPDGGPGRCCYLYRRVWGSLWGQHQFALSIRCNIWLIINPQQDAGEKLCIAEKGWVKSKFGLTRDEKVWQLDFDPRLFWLSVCSKDLRCSTLPEKMHSKRRTCQGKPNIVKLCDHCKASSTLLQEL